MPPSSTKAVSCDTDLGPNKSVLVNAGGGPEGLFGSVYESGKDLKQVLAGHAVEFNNEDNRNIYESDKFKLTVARDPFGVLRGSFEGVYDDGGQRRARYSGMDCYWSHDQ